MRQAWPAAVVGGFTFAIGQFLCSNYVSVELTDIVASLLAAGSIVLLLQVWTPSEPLRGEVQGGGAQPAIAGAAVSDATHEAEVQAQGGRRPRLHARRSSLAFAPYLIIIAVFALAQLGPIKDFLDGAHARSSTGRASTSRPRTARPSTSATFKFNWASAAGTLLLVLRPADDARAALQPGPGAAHARAHARRAQVGDAHRRHGARRWPT